MIHALQSTQGVGVPPPRKKAAMARRRQEGAGDPGEGEPDLHPPGHGRSARVPVVVGMASRPAEVRGRGMPS